jgi:hydrogenase maturation factor
MCVSRLHRVVAFLDDMRLTVCDLDQREQAVSLLAYEGPRPEVGDWVVVHSGFALSRAEAEEAEAALSELRSLDLRSGDHLNVPEPRAVGLDGRG